MTHILEDFSQAVKKIILEMGDFLEINVMLIIKEAQILIYKI